MAYLCLEIILNGLFKSLDLINRSLPIHLTSGIIRVCLDLAGLFRNKDIFSC